MKRAEYPTEPLRWPIAPDGYIPNSAIRGWMRRKLVESGCPVSCLIPWVDDFTAKKEDGGSEEEERRVEEEEEEDISTRIFCFIDDDEDDDKADDEAGDEEWEQGRKDEKNKKKTRKEWKKKENEVEGKDAVCEDREKVEEEMDGNIDTSYTQTQPKAPAGRRGKKGKKISSQFNSTPVQRRP